MPRPRTESATAPPLLQRVDVGRGREELFRDQMPELLSSLAEETRVASIRAERLAGGTRFRNRSERELAGYRDPIDELVRMDREPVSVGLLLHLHRQTFRHVDGAGGDFKRARLGNDESTAPPTVALPKQHSLATVPARNGAVARAPCMGKQQRAGR